MNSLEKQRFKSYMNRIVRKRYPKYGVNLKSLLVLEYIYRSGGIVSESDVRFFLGELGLVNKKTAFIRRLVRNGFVEYDGKGRVKLVKYISDDYVKEIYDTVRLILDGKEDIDSLAKYL